MTEPVLSRKTYTIVFLVLLALTLATTLIAYVNAGPFNVVIAIGIATIMASLVANFFMHALYESALVRVILGGGILWFLILITLTLADYLTRYSLSVPLKR